MMTNTSEPLTDDVIVRLREYLSLGGLWNPELMDVTKTQQLIIDSLHALEAAEALAAASRPSKKDEELDSRVAVERLPEGQDLPRKSRRGHIDIDCEVVRGVGWICTCQTADEKAEDERYRAECEAERDAESLRASASAPMTDDPLKDFAVEAAGASAEMIGILRKHGYVFERFPRNLETHPPITDGERWEALAFSLYLRLAELSTHAANAIAEAEEGDTDV